METEKKELEKRKTKPKPSLIKRFLPRRLQDPFVQKALLMVSFSVVIASLITPSFTSPRRSYQLGDIADRNIKNKREILIEDEAATAKKREEAARKSPAVYDLDDRVITSIQQRIENAFQTMRRGMKSDAEAQNRPELPGGMAGPEPAQIGLPLPADAVDQDRLAMQQRKDFEDLLGLEVSDEIFLSLAQRGFDEELCERSVHLLKCVFDLGVVSGKTLLSHGQGREIILRKIGSLEEMSLPPPYPFADVKEARKSLRAQAKEAWGQDDGTIAVGFLASQLLQPNVTFNPAETERRREITSTAIKPVYVHLGKNEMIVREGQRIGPEELLKLKGQGQGMAGRHWLIIFVTTFLSSVICIWVLAHVVKQHVPSFSMDLPDFLFLGLLLVILLIMGRFTMWVADVMGDISGNLSGRTLIYAIPISAGAMMASIFFGVTISLLFSLLLTIFAGMLFGKDFGLLLYFLIGSYIGAHVVTPCRNRTVPIKAGFLVGCVSAVLIILNAFLHEQIVFLGILTNAFFGFCGGIFAGVLVTGFTPLAEVVFGYTTDTKLLELATMDQPLLQSLMVQAPGTYHHSIVVGNMVEAAAKSIRANSLLAKVAAYYHDIGKTKKPLYYIENQVDCENRHEKLAPSMSSLILISHVKEGIELARQAHLPRQVIDIISQHHGTSFISFFYKKALEARERLQNQRGAALPPINVDDYRYPGPKPQTKEAGLVMLADVVEAACRSLSDPTPARIQGMVSRLINNIFSDGQLEECELTLKDLHSIAKHFNQILASIHHQRIEYPTVPLKEDKGKADASDPNQRDAKSDRDKSAAGAAGGRTDLKRLGIH